jgi:uncharacterized DUF497 family protein
MMMLVQRNQNPARKMRGQRFFTVNKLRENSRILKAERRARILQELTPVIAVLSLVITLADRLPMPHFEFIWIDGPDGNVRHLAENGVKPHEAEEVVRNPIATDKSASSGRLIAFGFTRSGRKLAVVYERIDSITVYPITAYDVED